MGNILNNFFSKLPFDNKSFMIIVYIIIGVCLFSLIVSVFLMMYKLRDSKGIVEKINRKNEIIYEEAIKMIKKNKKASSILEDIDLLLSRSQAKYKLHLNAYTFLLISFVCFFGGFWIMKDTSSGTITAIVAGVGFSFVPYVILEVTSSIRGKKLKKQIVNLISILINNAKITNQDIYQMMKKSSEKIQEPIKIYLEEFIEEFDSGIQINTCFDRLRRKVIDYRFTRIIDCLEVHLLKGGNIVITLNGLQKEYIARDNEEERRKKENLANVMGVYFVVIANFVIVYIVSKIMPEVMTELKSSSYDKYTLIAVVNTIISLFIAFKSTRIGTKKK